jgi:hypothetical protein
MSQIDALRTAILSLDGPVFAVLDGAQFENLPETLMFAGIEARCLYLDRGDNHPERLVTAPYMVGPLEGATLDRVLSALPKTSAAVFWECPDGADALYRHLRGLNRVLVPLDVPKIPAASEDGELQTHEAVLFRHADSNALDQVVPALGTVEMARVMGPAERLVFLPEGEARPKSVRSDPNWPRPVPGMLRIEAAQYSQMRNARLHRSRLTVARYLRDCAPDETADMSDDELFDAVLACERSGSQLGLRSEAAQAQWAFLMVTTGGEIEKGELVRRAVGRSHDPDKAVGDLMQEMVNLSQADQAISASGRG